MHVLNTDMRGHAAALFLAALLFVCITAAPARPAALPEAERFRIEALILAVEGLGDAVFIRNGKAYDAATAARFLRGKWGAGEAQVRTAEDFIEKVASFSSTTGKPYTIRFKDGSEVGSARFLRDRLVRLGERPGTTAPPLSP